jgi:hypothetical protein
MDIFTEEIKFVHSKAIPCPKHGGECKGHKIKLSWNEDDPKFPNIIWIDGVASYAIDDNELSSIVHLKNSFGQS